MSEPNSILAFESVSRKYLSQGNPAVYEVTLDLPQGEVLALIGESGSGKTTLLRLAAGLESPDSGRVSIQGEVVADAAKPRSEVPPEKRRIGLVFQDGALFPHLNAVRNVAYGLKSLDREERARRVSECLELVDLGGKEKRFPHELSGGERQRLALARALAPQPRLLLLDEPFSHLDPPLRRKLREEIRSILASLKQTAMIVTHDPEDALAISTRVAILNQGKLLQSGTPEDVYERPVDEYCAERFGPANAVVLNGSDTATWKRPERAVWLGDEPSKGESHLVRVLSIRPLGGSWEVRVRPVQWDEGSWVCRFHEISGIAENRKGYLSWR